MCSYAVVGQTEGHSIDGDMETGSVWRDYRWFQRNPNPLRSKQETACLLVAPSDYECLSTTAVQTYLRLPTVDPKNPASPQ